MLLALCLVLLVAGPYVCLPGLVDIIPTRMFSFEISARRGLRLMDVDQVKVYFPIAKEEECNQRGNARHDQCFVVLILFLAHIAAQSHRR